MDADYEPETVADQMHKRLCTQIWEGEFLPGDRVSIRALAQKSGLSVIPSRDAVRRLVAEGALRFADSRTIEVPRLSLPNHRDVLFARMQIEPETALRAFEQMTQHDVDMLVSHDREVDAAIAAGDPRRYMRANFAFHFHIYRKAGAPTLMRLIEILWLQYGPSMRFIVDQYGSDPLASDHHREATDALIRRDRVGFATALRSDIAQGMEFIRKAEAADAPR